MFEVREVLRLWLDSRSYRGIAELVPADRKTVTRVIEQPGEPPSGPPPETVLDGPLPWTRMRHIYALFRACDRYGNDRLERACERAVDAEATSVNIVIAMLDQTMIVWCDAVQEPMPP